MAVIIHWINQQEVNKNTLTVVTRVGNLIVQYVDDVIIQTEWCLDPSIILESTDHSLARQIQQYIDNPANTLALKLQKQGSAFRCKVWAEICKIPVGQVLTYSELAVKIDSGARAVANACRDNPFPAIIPCHRVVSASGLGGYMGQTDGKQLEIKKKLLAIELR